MVPPPVRLDDGTHIQLFKDGEALHAAFNAIAQAKYRICLEVYIFAGDETGQRFADLLAKKSREGVAVYLIYDAFGSAATPKSLFQMMKKAGVRMRVFHPIKPWECTFSWRPFNRDHRKLLVIDDHLGGLGGLNVGAEYAGSWIVKRTARIKTRLGRQPPCEFWRDNAIGITGPAVQVLRKAFERTWSYTSRGGRIAKAMTLHPDPAPSSAGSNHSARAFSVPTIGNHFSILASVPTLDSPLRSSLHKLFAVARKSIRLTIAYFAPDDDLIESLCKAARRGVDVRLMLPGKCDVPILVTAARAYYDTLLQAGIHIYERQSVVLHAKTMVIDQNISVIGSTNLDYRSIEYNLELSAILTSPEFGQQMHTLFDNDIRYAKKISPATWKRRPTWDRITQWTVSRGRYLL